MIHISGDIASELASKAVSKYFSEISQTDLVSLREEANEQNVDVGALLMKKAITQANELVIAFNKQKKPPGDGGTTVSGVLLMDGKAVVLNVGDSRTSLIRRKKDGTDDEIISTIDNSLVERLIATGQIKREDAKLHLQANVIYRTIGDKPIDFQIDGTPGTTGEPSIFVWDVEEGDRILGRCDGVDGGFTSYSIAEASHLRWNSIENLVASSASSLDNRSGFALTIGKRTSVENRAEVEGRLAETLNVVYKAIEANKKSDIPINNRVILETILALFDASKDFVDINIDDAKKSIQFIFEKLGLVEKQVYSPSAKLAKAIAGFLGGAKSHQEQNVSELKNKALEACLVLTRQEDVRKNIYQIVSLLLE